MTHRRGSNDSTVRAMLWLVLWMHLLLPAQNRAEACQASASLSGESKPSDVRPEWKGLIGEYTLGYDTVSVFEKDGVLVLSKDSGRPYRLQPEGTDRFELFPAWEDGGRTCIVHRNTAGFGVSLELHPSIFRRIFYGGEDGASFRIKPLRPADALRREALRATPPQEEGNFRKFDLVELKTLDSTINLDVRYATTNNFMGERFYSQARAFLQRPAAEALVRVHGALRTMGYGILVHDAYRPWYVTKMFWDATPREQKDFVADPAKGSRHNRGCAVDLSLYDLKTGKAIEMVCGYDEFSHRAYPGYPGGTSLQRWHRQLLRRMMEAEGFKVFDVEWWHFDFSDWRSYPIGTLTFEEIH
jgi:D-alanyl-D-alanine dipeptidase